MSPDDQAAQGAALGGLASEDRRTDQAGREHFIQVVSTHLSRVGQKGGQARTSSKRASAKDNLAKARAAKAAYRQQPGLRPQGWKPEE